MFPVAALGFCGWFTYKYFEGRGQTIQIEFLDAGSVKPEKTRVMYRGVPVGVVKQITLSEDSSKAVVEVLLQRSANKLAVEGSRFYLVTPKVSMEGISGLETILSGSYISVVPGNPEGELKKDFEGQPEASSDLNAENSRHFILETEHAESVSVGDTIFYRGLEVGVVRRVGLSKSAQTVLIDINIQNRYARVVRTNTVFWKKQGVQADIGLFGSKIKINSFDTILRGGIEFATPNEAGPAAKWGMKFTLLDVEPKERSRTKWNPSLASSK